MKDNTCPYPGHPGYMAVRDTLAPEAQMRMAETVRITADQKVEIVPLHKKFSLLSAEHNGIDIFSGDVNDKKGNQGIPGLIYFTGEAAERVCREQGKRLFDIREEVEDFIDHLPGQYQQEKITNLMCIMGLEGSGCWHPGNGKWYLVGAHSHATLSHIIESKVTKNDVLLDEKSFLVYGIRGATTQYFLEKYSQPVIVFEDC